MKNLNVLDLFDDQFLIERLSKLGDIPQNFMNILIGKY